MPVDLSQYSTEDLQRMSVSASLQSMSDADLRSLARNAGVNASPGGSSTTSSGASWGPVSSVANASLFGVGPNIKAAAAATKEALSGGLPWGDAYDQALAMYRGAHNQYATDHPVGEAVSNVAGASLPILATMGAATPGLAAAQSPTLFGAMARASGVGAAYGGLNGFGSGEGGFVPRLESGGEGAAIGGTVGGAMPLAGKIAGTVWNATGMPGVASKVWNWAQSKIPGIADSLPSRKVAEAFTRDGIPVNDVTDAGGNVVTPGINSRLAAYGPGGTLTDVGGENVLGLAKGAANLPGPQRQQAAELVASRRAARGGQLVDALTDNLGAGDFNTSMQNWAQQRATDAAPLYEKAFAQTNVTSPNIERILQDPVMQDGIRRGLAIQRIEATTNGTTFNPNDYGVTGFKSVMDPYTGAATQVPELSGTPNMRLLDAAKKGLDDIVEGYRSDVTGKLNLDQYGRAVNNLRAAYVKALDIANPDYAAARQAFAGPSQLMDAARLGTRFASRDPEVTTQMLNGMTESEKDAFRTGSLYALKNSINSDTARAAGKFDSTKAQFLDRLRATFPDQSSFDTFKTQADKILSEARRDQMINPRAGSHTAPLNAQFQDMGIDPSAAFGAARSILSDPTNPMSYLRALGTGYRALQDWNARPPTSIAPQIGQMLYSTDPAAQQAAIQALQPRGVFDFLGRNTTSAPLRGILAANMGQLSGNLAASQNQ